MTPRYRGSASVDVPAQARERRRQRAEHVGQSAGLRERHRLRPDHQDGRAHRHHCSGSTGTAARCARTRGVMAVTDVSAPDRRRTIACVTERPAASAARRIARGRRAEAAQGRRSPSWPRPSTCSSRSSRCSAACSRACRCRGFRRTTAWLRAQQAAGRPLVRFGDIPLDWTDFRLTLRQTADILRRFDALEPADYTTRSSRSRRDGNALEPLVAQWYTATSGAGRRRQPDGPPAASIRCSCSRCGRFSRAAPRC